MHRHSFCPCGGQAAYVTESVTFTTRLTRWSVLAHGMWSISLSADREAVLAHVCVAASHVRCGATDPMDPTTYLRLVGQLMPTQPYQQASACI